MSGEICSQTESVTNLNGACAGRVEHLKEEAFSTASIQHKKVTFDDSCCVTLESNGAGALKLRTTYDLERDIASSFRPRDGIARHFCDWFPELFGIDEDTMESSEDEPSLLEEEELGEWDEGEFTEEDLNILREKNPMLTDDDLKKMWKKNQVPRYGRRAKERPIFLNEDKEKFDCKCGIDRFYAPYHISRFGGGVKNEDEEWRVPHFVAYWEEFWEKAEKTDEDDWSKIFEAPTQTEDETTEKGLLFRPVPKFASSSKKELKNYRKQLLGSLRPLDCREIRRHRMPYAEAVYLELQEDRYFETALYFRYLLEKDYYIHNSESNFDPPLRQIKDKMTKIVAFLKGAERFGRRKDYTKQALIFLKSGKYFNDLRSNWWWLAEEFYKKAVKISQKIKVDGGKLEAIARYIYGTFLLDSVYRVQDAQEHLSKARDLSLGKTWNAGRIVQKKQEPLYQECTNYLCRSLIEASKELRKSGKPEEALPLIHRAYRICIESGLSRSDIKMETLFELGMAYETLGFFDWAQETFRKFLEIARLENYTKRICDGLLEVAICFRSMGDLHHCHQYLVKYLETAKRKEDENLTAFGNRYLGEYHLNNGDPSVAVDFFRNAFEGFHQQTQKTLELPFGEWRQENFTLLNDMELTRVLVGLAEGEALTKQICEVINQAKDGENREAMQSLNEWKTKGDKTLIMEPLKISDKPTFDDDDFFSERFEIQLMKESSLSTGSFADSLGSSAHIKEKYKQKLLNLELHA